MGKVWYLCDGEREKCNKNLCFLNAKENPCRHTSDIKHAVNFEEEKVGEEVNYREKSEREEDYRKREEELKKRILEEMKKQTEMLEELIGNKEKRGGPQKSL